MVSRIWTKLSSKSPTDASMFLEANETMLQFLDKHKLNHIFVFLDFMSNHTIGDNRNANLTIYSVPNNKLGSIGIKNQLQNLQYNYDGMQKLAITDTNSDKKATKETTNQASVAYSKEMSELVQEVIFALVGVSGKYLIKDPKTGIFDLHPKNKIGSTAQRKMMLRLAEVGTLFNRIKLYCTPNSGFTIPGLFGQGMITALDVELSNYRAMVALLQEQLNQQVMENEYSEPLTLLKLQVWCTEPHARLRWLNEIVNDVAKADGGSILSIVHDYLSVGDPVVRRMANDILIAMCKPLQNMLVNWLLNGEIEDPSNEFFIVEVPGVTFDQLWDERYRVDTTRLPTFISPELAEKILVTGKTHNFTKVVCQNRTIYKDAKEMQKVFENNIDSLFASTGGTKVHEIIDKAYLDTSKILLDVVLEQFNLVTHLTALKKFLLLGQGDFIGLLMQTLKAELDRPAKDLFRHDLHSMMCTALRSSSAQFEDQQILDNLEVYLLDPFDGDLGWDTFTFQYRMDGPLLTIFRNLDEYRVIFKPLLNIKRIEFVLQKVWKEQILTTKHFKYVNDDIKMIRVRLNTFTSEMIQFIHQVHYYTMFEVIECSWTSLLENIKASTTLDDIVKHHAEFLEQIRVGMFLQENRKDLFNAMDSIFNAIMKLEKWQEKFLAVCSAEENERLTFETRINVSEKRGTHGYTTKQRFDRDEKAKFFEASMFQYMKSLDIISKEYSKYVRDFIYKLTASNATDLQLFGIRLDFNEFYKNSDQSLKMPLTIEHLRRSTMFMNQSMSGSGSFGNVTKSAAALELNPTVVQPMKVIKARKTTEAPKVAKEVKPTKTSSRATTSNMKT